MADPKNPRAGEVWERDGVRRTIIWTTGPYPYRVTYYQIGDFRRHVSFVDPTWFRWAKKATCIKEADRG